MTCAVMQPGPGPVLRASTVMTPSASDALVIVMPKPEFDRAPSAMTTTISVEKSTVGSGGRGPASRSCILFQVACHVSRSRTTTVAASSHPLAPTDASSSARKRASGKSTHAGATQAVVVGAAGCVHAADTRTTDGLDRKSTRLNSSHDQISYAVFCLKKIQTC